MKRNQISLLLSSLVVSTSIIAGCNSGTSSSSPQATSETISTARQVPVSISPMAAIPLTGVGHQFSLRISNAAATDYTLDSIEVIDPLTGRSTDKVIINSATCEKIAKNSYCVVKVTPQVDKSSAFIIRARVSGDGKQETISQLLRVSDKIKAHNGIYFNNDINEVVANGKSKYTLALPVVLDDDFSTLKVSNGLLDCEDKSKGSACTYILNGAISADKTLVATNIEGTHKHSGQKEQLLKSDTLVRTNIDYSKILLSQPADIVADKDGKHTPATVIAYNLGNLEATDIDVTASQGFSATNNCGTTLAGGNSCIIPVDVANSSDLVSVSGSLTLKYDNPQKTASTQLFYDAANLDAKLTLTPVGNPDFENVLVTDTRRATYTLENTGDKTLTDIQIGLDGNGFSHTSCPASLAAGETCQIEVTYTPRSPDSGLTNLVVTGKYKVKEGQVTEDKTIYANVAIDYSSDAVFTRFHVSPELGYNFAAQHGGSISKSYKITNLSNYPSTLSAATIATNAATAAGEFTVDNGCETTLTNNGSCDLKATFTPTKDYDIKGIEITVPATGFGAAPANDIKMTANLSSNATTAAEPDIEVHPVFVLQYEGANSSASFATINDLANPTEISFGLFSGRRVVLQYIFENKAGAGAANNFNVAVGGIPSAFEVEARNTNCPLGQTAGILQAGTECHVAVKIPKDKYFAAGMLNGVSLAENLVLPYSYENLATNTYEEKSTTPVELNISNRVADGLTLKAEAKAANDKIDVELEVTHTGLNQLVSTTDTEISVSATIKGMPASASQSCDLAAGTTTCTVLKLPLSFPKGEHSLDVTITPKGNANLKQHKVVKFTV